jgi:hypothetical protein
MRRSTIFVSLAFVAGCGAEEEALPDAGACTPGQIVFGDGCVPPAPGDPAAVCAYVAQLGAGCVDDDGDCYVAGCDIALPSEVIDVIRDCDDRRPDVHPAAGELCDAVDNDCDGAEDEDFHVGDPCANACGEGKVECAVDDPTRAACSTEAGQSAANPEAVERCNMTDDDCDGEVDERCRVDLDPAERGAPRVCGTDLVFVEAGALVPVPNGGVGTLDARPVVSTVVEGPGVAAPACGDAGFAWLQLEPEGDAPACSEPADGPRRCRAHLWTRGADGVPRDRTGLAEVGAPVIAGDAVLWHAIDGGRLRLRRARLDGTGAIDEAGENHSDPAVGAGDDLAVREWAGGAPEVLLRKLAAGTGERDLAGPDGQRPGPPALSADWAVWSLGRPATLWAVDLASGEGFQVVDLPGDQLAPRLDGSRVVWLDAGTRPPTLRELDLVTGVGGEVARGDVAPDDFTVRDGVVLWIAREAAGDAVYRHALPPSP